MEDQISHGTDTYGIDPEAISYSLVQVQVSILNYHFWKAVPTANKNGTWMLSDKQDLRLTTVFANKVQTQAGDLHICR